jgi:hypothetical protein
MRIKNYQEHPHKVELQKLQNKKNSVLILRQLYRDSFQIETETIKELNEHLMKISGFKNPLLSADSIGKKKDYNLILELSKGINIEDYTIKGELTKAFLTTLKDKYTQYYTNAEITHLEAIKVVVEAVNSIPKEDASAIQFNSFLKTYVYRQQMAQTNQQLSRR